ncbi:hypothetical protein PR003_g32621, partial [Phytophthora rubi]
MRLYSVLVATAVALIATNNVAAEKHEDFMLLSGGHGGRDRGTIKTTAPVATTATPVASTTSSYTDPASAEAAFDNDASTAASAVDASQATTSDEDEGSAVAASSVAASAAT